MNDEEQQASKTLLDLVEKEFAGNTTMVTTEQLAHVYSTMIHLRDVVATQAAILAMMPLTTAQAKLFNENDMPLHALQKAIGDGLVALSSSIHGSGSD